MRLVQYRANGESRLGVVIEDRIIDVQHSAASAGKDARAFSSSIALLEAGEPALAFVRALTANTNAALFSTASLDCPVASRKIVAVGLNYRDHAIEAGL